MLADLKKGEIEMGKAIYWIDDNPHVIINIVDGVFSKLWKLDDEEGIETHIRILGNGGQETRGLRLWEKDDEKQFRTAIMQRFEQLCSNADKLGEKNIFQKKSGLISDNIIMMYKSPVNDIEEREVEEYRKMYYIWQNNSCKMDGENISITNEARDCTEILLQKMGIEKGACVGLDMALFHGDIEKVKDEGKPILSMELYHMIKQTHECFMYSHYMFDKRFIESWKEVYSKAYGDKELPIIHKRSELFAKNVSETLINQLLELVDKSYKRREGNL